MILLTISSRGRKSHGCIRSLRIKTLGDSFRDVIWYMIEDLRGKIVEAIVIRDEHDDGNTFLNIVGYTRDYPATTDITGVTAVMSVAAG